MDIYNYVTSHKLVSPVQASGDQIVLRTNNPRHMQAGGALVGDKNPEVRYVSTREADSFHSISTEAPRFQAREGADKSLNATDSFQTMFFKALQGVSKNETHALDLNQKMIVDPDNVNVHDVTIAMAKADMSLGIAKAVVDRAVKAYNEILAIR